MGAEVTVPKHQGVDVNHPRIVETIRRMVKEGKKTEEIMRVVGMPAEVINNIRNAEK